MSRMMKKKSITEDKEVTLTEDEIGNLFQDTSPEEELDTE